MDYSIKDQLLNFVNNPKQKGLSEEQKLKSIKASVKGCDDNFNIFIDINDGIIKTARFEGEGCAISNAAIEALFGIVENKKVSEANDIIKLYIDFLNGEDNLVPNELKVFKIIQTHVSRKKCALVPIDPILKKINN